MAAKKNFYLVLKGKQPGIYSTWAECQAQTNKYPGAVFKGFTTQEELYHYLGEMKIVPSFIAEADFTKKVKAQEYQEYLTRASINLSSLTAFSTASQVGTSQVGTLEAEVSQKEVAQTKVSSQASSKVKAPSSSSKVLSSAALNQKIEEEIAHLTSTQGIAFVDGSFDKSNFTYSYGLVLLTKKQTITDSQQLNDPRFVNARNVAGEIAGVQRAITLAYEKGLTDIKIFYDYKGIEYWATGLWQAKQELTKEYKNFFKHYSKLLTISFEHVPAHTGIKYNEQADQLAKQALGIK